MRPKGRGPADASPGGKKPGKRVKEEEETVQAHPQRRDGAHGSRGDDGLAGPGPGRSPPDPEKGDSETASEEGYQVGRRLGRGHSPPAFGGCGPQAAAADLPHWCLECGKNFGRKAELEAHQLSHAGGPCAYICGDCGRSFLDHVALVAGQGACAAGTAFHHAGCRKRTPPFASAGEPAAVQRKERKELSLQEKVRVLEVLEGPKVSQSELAKRFGVSQPQICRIIKNKERILAEWCKSANPGRKRKLEDQPPAAAAGESALFQWFQRSCASADRALAQGTAGRLPEGRGQPERGPGRGWLSSFGGKEPAQGPPLGGRRAGSENGERAGEEPWEHAVLPGVLSRYAPPDVYACGEVGLLFRATPGGPAQEGSEEQLTVLLCANMDASDKREVLVVGASREPLGPPGSPPAAYEASPRAWMTAAVFGEWLRAFNEEMRRQGRSVALCLVPCAAHPSAELSNVSLVFMPPRPSRHNPLEQGVAQSFRCHYRRRLLVRLLAGVGSKAAPGRTGRLSERLSLWDALHLIVQAWAEVCPQTIASCFQAAGFSASPPFPTPPAAVVQALGFQSQEQFRQFALVDDGLECFGNPDDAQVVKGDLWGSETIHAAGEEVEAEGEEAEGGEAVPKTEGPPLPPCPTRAEVTESLAKVRRYLECQAVPPASFQAFYALEDVVHGVLIAGRQACPEALGQE